MIALRTAENEAVVRASFDTLGLNTRRVIHNRAAKVARLVEEGIICYVPIGQISGKGSA